MRHDATKGKKEGRRKKKKRNSEEKRACARVTKANALKGGVGERERRGACAVVFHGCLVTVGRAI